MSAKANGATPKRGPAWLKAKGDGVTVTVVAQPNAKATEIAGEHGEALKIKVASPPVDGAANDALLDFLAAKAGVKRRAVTLVRGQTSRQKVFEITGITLEEARLRLAP